METKVLCVRLPEKLVEDFDNLWLDLIVVFSDNPKRKKISKALLIEEIMNLIIEDFKIRRAESFVYKKMNFRLKHLSKSKDKK